MTHNPDNCKACDSPLVNGVCQLCSELETINSTISTEPVTETEEKVWNWDSFFQMVGNDELAINADSSDEEIETRILALQELDKQTELLRQSIRFRISVNYTELEARGKRPRKLSGSKPAIFDGPKLAKANKAPLSKLEKAKASLNELGVDFDALMLDMKKTLGK